MVKFWKNKYKPLRTSKPKQDGLGVHLNNVDFSNLCLYTYCVFQTILPLRLINIISEYVYSEII